MFLVKIFGNERQNEDMSGTLKIKTLSKKLKIYRKMVSELTNDSFIKQETKITYMKFVLGSKLKEFRK